MSVNNVSKIMQYLRLMTKNPVEVDSVTYDLYRKQIRLADTFFDTDDCISCNCCCVTEDNVFTEYEYGIIQNTKPEDFINHGNPAENLQKLKDGLVEEIHTVNGHEVKLYVYKNSPQKWYVERKQRECDRCGWIYEDNGRFLCGIHLVSSITCKMPHLRMFYNSSSGTISLAISQYGRNWALGCPIKFRKPKDEEEFINIHKSRVEKLQLLDNVAKSLTIDTYIPEIIDYISNITWDNYKERIGKPVIVFDKVHKMI